MSHEHKDQAPTDLKFAIITVSDTRTKTSDESGRLINDLLVEAGYEVKHYEIVKDDFLAIKRAIKEFAKDVDVIISNGGTGVSKKDITIECASSFLDKKLDGFGELFRMLSYEDIGSSALMSRALAGVFGKRIIICLPGSPKAVELGMKKLVLPEVGHMVWEARR